MKLLRVVAALSAMATSTLGTSAQSLSDLGPPGEPLVLSQQGSFFVGGREVYSETLSTLPTNPPTGTITVDQVYVRYQVPVDATRRPVTLIHGCCLTGKTWETTPDGRMGWDEYFVRQGHAVYVIDQVARGRSAANPSVINSVRLGRTPPDQLPAVYSSGHEAAWTIFRFGPDYPNEYPGLQFPVEAIAEFWKQMVLDWARSLPAPNPTVAALSELAVRLDGTVLISHSQSGNYPFQTVALNPKGVSGIVAIEPSVCPDASADLTPYTKIPILVLWADYVELSPRWAPRLKTCKAFAEAVNEAGGEVEHIVLPEIGIRGNSHMLMQDKNSLQVADWVLAWIDRNVEASARP
jgi:pimeloyl-ACP methyl ester carboxylesterase